MKCSICEEKITHCDECGCPFKKKDIIFCDDENFGDHKCYDCYIPAEEGEVI